MTNPRVSWQIIVLIITSFVASAFAQQAPSNSNSTTDINHYLLYSKDGLSVKHPPHWIIGYDDVPDLFADRGISFKVSESSYVDLLIFTERNVNLEDLANYYEKSLGLKSSSLYRNYQRLPTAMAGYKGISLRWLNAFLVEYPVELTLLQLRESPNGVFIVVNLDEKLAARESAHSIPFIDSIQVK